MFKTTTKYRHMMEWKVWVLPFSHSECRNEQKGWRSDRSEHRWKNRMLFCENFLQLSTFSLSFQTGHALKSWFWLMFQWSGLTKALILNDTQVKRHWACQYPTQTASSTKNLLQLLLFTFTFYFVTFTNVCGEAWQYTTVKDTTSKRLFPRCSRRLTAPMTVC